MTFHVPNPAVQRDGQPGALVGSLRAPATTHFYVSPHMTAQSRKHTLGLSGEFLVAGELLRRGLHASVTYGNAKKADVVVLSKSRRNAMVIEVKTTSQTSWVVGGTLPKKDNDELWVFVHLPTLENSPPRYFVLTSMELHSIVVAEYDAYCERYRKRNGGEFSGNPVHNLSLKQALSFEGKWQKVLEREI